MSTEISTTNTIKKLTQKMDALLSKYNPAYEGFTSIRSVIELLNPASSLMFHIYRKYSLCKNTTYTRLL